MLDDLRLYPRHHSPGAEPKVTPALELADCVLVGTCFECDGQGFRWRLLDGGRLISTCGQCRGTGSQLRHAYAEGSGEQ